MLSLNDGSKSLFLSTAGNNSALEDILKVVESAERMNKCVVIED